MNVFRRQSIINTVGLQAAVKQKLSGEQPSPLISSRINRIDDLTAIDCLSDSDFETCFGMSREDFNMRLEMASPLLDKDKAKSLCSPSNPTNC